MRRIVLPVLLCVFVAMFFAIHSCTKSINDGFVEPITIISPSSLTVNNIPAGSVQPVQIQFTTDRPLLWARCFYEIDTPGGAASYTYPDTLFYRVLDSTYSQLNNKYTYTGAYMVPDSLKSTTNIRFDVQFKAALNPSSPDTVFYDKQFKFVVR